MAPTLEATEPDTLATEAATVASEEAEEAKTAPAEAADDDTEAVAHQYPSTQSFLDRLGVGERTDVLGRAVGRSSGLGSCEVARRTVIRDAVGVRSREGSRSTKTGHISERDARRKLIRLGELKDASVHAHGDQRERTLILRQLVAQAGGA